MMELQINTEVLLPQGKEINMAIVLEDEDWCVIGLKKKQS